MVLDQIKHSCFECFFCNGQLQKCERNGKEYVLLSVCLKLRYRNESSTKKLESFPRIELFGGGKWQNGNSSNSTQNSGVVWIG